MEMIRNKMKAIYFEVYIPKKEEGVQTDSKKNKSREKVGPKKKMPVRGEKYRRRKKICRKR